MNILSEIITILHKSFVYNNTEININTTFKDLGLDSLDVISLVMEVENKFNIDIPDDIYEEFVSIKDYVNYLKEIVNAI